MPVKVGRCAWCNQWVRLEYLGSKDRYPGPNNPQNYETVIHDEPKASYDKVLKEHLYEMCDGSALEPLEVRNRKAGDR